MRVAVESALAATCWRLGCRVESPYEWWPEHLVDSLSEDMMMEAWILMRIRSQMRSVRSGQRIEGPTADARFCVTREERMRRGPLLWERDAVWPDATAVTYQKRLATRGVVWWEDMWSDECDDWCEWNEARERYGLVVSSPIDLYSLVVPL